MAQREMSPLEQLITGIIVVIVLFYVFVWQPIVTWWQITTKAIGDWFQANLFYIILIPTIIG